ncbi:hypothetical protein ABW20_dc0109606 [Dactylellina cionopaga]|nr:hypothetical protein ABW20_dc0109606 [Dactylellina cionopaga]
MFGTIKGSIEDEVIMLGNHRDSWGAGAADSSSGATALMEVVRSFATAYKIGWRPRRTLIFVSWEGEEIGQAGSRPWIASNLPWLRETAITYLNVVVGAAGRQFQAKGSPLLQEAIHRATKLVASPEGGTVFDRWGGEMMAAGGGDANIFQGTACISTSDFSFGASFWSYHSNFDTFAWMNTTGDPGWKYHVTTAKIWALVAAYLSESPVLRIKAADYGVAMRKYVKRIKESVPNPVPLDLGPLENAIEEFHDASMVFDAFSSSLRSIETDGMDETIRRVNKKYIDIERQFCYKNEHLVYEFSPFYLNSPEFPHIFGSVQSGDLEKARVSNSLKVSFLSDSRADHVKEWMEITQARIRDAANLLKS